MTAAHHHDTGTTQHRGGHPVIKCFLILLGVGLFIRLLPYLLAELGIEEARRLWRALGFPRGRRRAAGVHQRRWLL